MMKTRLPILNYLGLFQDKDNFFEQLTSDKDTFRTIISQYILLNLFSLIYGIVMGSNHSFRQAVSSGLKVPILFSLALLICFPAFFIIQYALGSKLKFWQMLKVILLGFVLMSLIMASCAPIVIFFIITGNNFAFLKLLHVAIMGLAGIFGMKTISDALRFACEKKNVYPKVGVVVFWFWIVILGFVGTQLAWNLRPFVGSEGLPFELFGKREGNFYIAVIQETGNLITPSNDKKDNKEVKRPNRQRLEGQTEKGEADEE